MTPIGSRQIKLKTISIIRSLVTAACLLSGWLAGNSIDKYLIRIRAWRETGLMHWAEFSRHEYLDIGFYFYLTEALSCSLLLLLAAIIAFRNKFTFIRWYIASGFVITLGFIAITFHTAPLMFKLQEGGNDLNTVTQIFDTTNYWGLYRGVLHLACFIFCLIAVGKSYVLKYVNNS